MHNINCSIAQSICSLDYSSVQFVFFFLLLFPSLFSFIIIISSVDVKCEWFFAINTIYDGGNWALGFNTRKFRCKSNAFKERLCNNLGSCALIASTGGSWPDSLSITLNYDGFISFSCWKIILFYIIAV